MKMRFFFAIWRLNCWTSLKPLGQCFRSLKQKKKRRKQKENSLFFRFLRIFSVQKFFFLNPIHSPSQPVEWTLLEAFQPCKYTVIHTQKFAITYDVYIYTLYSSSITKLYTHRDSHVFFVIYKMIKYKTI